MNSNSKPIIGIISPCYNEEQALVETEKQLRNLIVEMVADNLISNQSFVAFIDDGSKDGTWKTIETKANQNTQIKGLKLVGNVGHQNALLAGLLTFNEQADALISIDADLQDDISVIAQMIQKFQSGIDVVYGVRKERSTDTFFKRNSALLFYWFIQKMKSNMIRNHADYRLCSQRVIHNLSYFNEINLFLRGIIPSMGFTSDVIYYDRLERKAGSSKYPFRKMLSFAWNGITSFSTFPLKLVTAIGFIVFFLCLLMSVYAGFAIYTGDAVPGWLSTVLPMYFLGGIQLFSIGVIGEYIGKIYAEVKQRPRYIVDKKVG
jgi:glycosyltransferase involved in cell wall biosynthesis